FGIQKDEAARVGISQPLVASQPGQDCRVLLEPVGETVGAVKRACLVNARHPKADPILTRDALAVNQLVDIAAGGLLPGSRFEVAPGRHAEPLKPPPQVIHSRGPSPYSWRTPAYCTAKSM